MTYRRKLIEVAIPLEAINKEALHRKQKAPKGWPASFHKWWTQKPLAAARAVIFAQMVDDPSSNPDLFPTEKEQEKERQRLFRLIEDLVQWDNTGNERVSKSAHDEILRSWRRTCAENIDDPRAKELFDHRILPSFADPFSGSGSLPLSAQWLGLESYASDLNPVAVLINKAVIEIPPKFAGRPPVHPEARQDKNLFEREWKGTQGLAEDVRYYGQWMRDEAEKRIGRLYPKCEITAQMVTERPDLKPYVGKSFIVVAWLWARTVKSPNPAFAQVDVPLTSTFVFSTKAGKEAYVYPVIENGGYSFTVKMGNPKDAETAKNGTKLSRGANFRCLLSGVPLTADYIKTEAKKRGFGARLMAIVADGEGGRVYLPATEEMEAVAREAKPDWMPEGVLVEDARAFTPTLYGIAKWSDLFSPRQLVSLTTFSDLVNESREHVKRRAEASDLPNDDKPLHDGGTGPQAYADAVAVYLACVVDRMAYYGSNLTTWLPKDNALRDSMPRQALAMSWEYAEGNPLGKSSGDVTTCTSAVSSYLDLAKPHARAFVKAEAAQAPLGGISKYVISTDPPYYDNVPYADLSDFFYVWLRRSLKPVFPDLFATLAVPKAEELVACSYRHDSRTGAERFFLDGMTQAMRRLAEQAHPAFPVTIYYAFKQTESDDSEGTASTGWETFLDALIRAGFATTGTWPLRTEGAGRMRAVDSNALAASIVLVCRPRAKDAPTATRREFLSALKNELPDAVKNLQHGNIAPVDLAQAAIGPGMAVYTRYSKVINASGQLLSVRDALTLINQTLDEVLAEQEGDFDADSRWALAWFDQSGFAEGEYGVAETLSKAKNTSVAGMVEAGILKSKSGKVRLLRPDELSTTWDPESDPRLTAWESVQHLVRALESGGEPAAAELVAKLGVEAEIARELAYRLYTVCERKKRAQEALSYNALVQSWPEIARLAHDGTKPQASQAEMFVQE